MARRSNNDNVKDAVRIHLMSYPLYGCVQIIAVILFSPIYRLLRET